MPRLYQQKLVLVIRCDCTWFSHITHSHALLTRHEPEVREDDETSEHGGAGVDAADDQSILVDVVVILVVWSKSNNCSQTKTIGEEDLGGGINPDPGLGQLGEVWHQIEVDSISCTVQSDSSEEEDGEEEVGEERSEVDNLASPLDTLPDAEVAENPGNAESDDQVNSQSSSIINLE